jgi:hypothetical protein
MKNHFSSFIFPATLLIGLLINSKFNKKNKKVNEINQKKYMEGKIKGYSIFYNTIIDFLKLENIEYTFDNFLKTMWESDYIYYSNKERNYSTWKLMYLEVEKNKNISLENLMMIGENKSITF